MFVDKETWRRIILRSIIVQPIVIAVVSPYYFFVLNFTTDQWLLWLWSSQPLNILGINFAVFSWIELLRKSERLRRLI